MGRATMISRWLAIAVLIVVHAFAFDGIRIDVDVSALKPEKGHWTPDMYMKLSSPSISEICRAKLTTLSRGKTPCNIPRKYIKKGYNPYHITIFSSKSGTVYASMDASFDVDDETFSAIATNSKRSQFAWKIPLVATAGILAAVITKYNKPGNEFGTYFLEAFVLNLETNFNKVMRPILHRGYIYDEHGKLVRMHQRSPVKAKPVVPKSVIAAPKRKASPPPKPSKPPPPNIAAPKVINQKSPTLTSLEGSIQNILNMLSIRPSEPTTVIVEPTPRELSSKARTKQRKLRVLTGAALLGAGALLGGLAYGYRKGFVIRASVEKDRVKTEKPKLNFIVPDSELKRAKLAPKPAPQIVQKPPSKPAPKPTAKPVANPTVKPAKTQSVSTTGRSSVFPWRSKEVKVAKVAEVAKETKQITKSPGKPAPTSVKPTEVPVKPMKVAPVAQPRQPVPKVPVQTPVRPAKSSIIVNPNGLPQLESPQQKAVKVDKSGSSGSLFNRAARTREEMPVAKESDAARQRAAERDSEDKLRAQKHAAEVKAKAKAAELKKREEKDAKLRLEKLLATSKQEEARRLEKEKSQREKAQQLEAKKQEESKARLEKDKIRRAEEEQRRKDSFEKKLTAERLQREMQQKREADKQARERERHERMLAAQKDKEQIAAKAQRKQLERKRAEQQKKGKVEYACIYNRYT